MREYTCVMVCMCDGVHEEVCMRDEQLCGGTTLDMGPPTDQTYISGLCQFAVEVVVLSVFLLQLVFNCSQALYH